MHKSSKAQQETTEETEIVGDVKKIKNPKPKGWPKALALSTSKYGENTTKENYFCKVGTFPHGTALLGASEKLQTRHSSAGNLLQAPVYYMKPKHRNSKQKRQSS